MIIEEKATLKSGRVLIKRYSDAGVKLIQTPTGILYDDAIDVENAPYVYIESNIPVDPVPESQ